MPIRPLAKGSLVKLWVALAILVLAAAGLAWWGTAAWQVITLDSGVRYRVVSEGTGAPITPADVFAINYRLHVNDINAPVLESTESSGQPYVATVAEIFPGFGEALQRMRARGRYQVWLPPGTHVSGPLPPGTPFSAQDTLVFEVEVLQIAAGMASARQMQMLQQMMQAAPPGAEGGNSSAGSEGNTSAGNSSSGNSSSGNSSAGNTKAGR